MTNAIPMPIIKGSWNGSSVPVPPPKAAGTVLDVSAVHRPSI